MSEASGANQYEYFAFISYSRMDSRQARWLHWELENFCFPLAEVALENRPPHEKYLRPIARDKFALDVNAEKFWDDIKSRLNRSRYLIVLCSQNSVSSTYINREIEHFLNGRPEAHKYLIPVILNGCPCKGGAEECFPSSLRAISDTLLSRNLPAMIPDKGAPLSEGMENGLFQTLSYLLKVERNKIETLYHRQKRRELKRRVLIILVLLFFFGLITSWAVLAERRAARSEKFAIEQYERAEKEKSRRVEMELEIDRLKYGMGNIFTSNEGTSNSLPGDVTSTEVKFIGN